MVLLMDAAIETAMLGVIVMYCSSVIQFVRTCHLNQRDLHCETRFFRRLPRVVSDP